MKALIDQIPLGILLIATFWMLIAPVSPMPHLLEKFYMFRAGTLIRPIDWFDVVFHLTPLVLLVIKLFYRFGILR
jgi:hypothetical protein